MLYRIGKAHTCFALKVTSLMKEPGSALSKPTHFSEVSTELIP